ncbi:hypothetical protein Tco_0680814 [Tanacetum coccineum]|uniref:Uncharacterized protein n=1 Tax=Tanacetum coccineum TaxID=301880 RepID=A0ABQ4XN52_9ASTR
MFQRSRSKAPSDSVTILPRASGKIGVVELYSWTNYQLADILTKQYKRTVRICSSTPKHEEFEPRKLSDAFKKERMNKRSVLCYPLLNDSGGIAVQVTFSSQSMTTALLIENGSLFERESEFENLLHHTEFTQGIQTFFSHKASHKASLKDPKKKAVPLLIPYGRFTKMIIYYVGSTSNVHRRPESPRHLPGDDFLLGNLKFIPKGETNEVFGMAIPKPLITEAIQQSSYYPKYLEMVAKNTKKTPQDREGDIPPLNWPRSEFRMASRKRRRKYKDSRCRRKERLLFTEEQAHTTKLIDLSKKKSTTDQFILQRRDQAPHDSTTGPSSQPQDDTSEKVVHESSSTTDSERTESGTEATAPKVDKEQGEVASTTVTSGVGISVRTENQAGSDPGQGHEALAGSNLEPMQEDSGPGKEHVALAGPNPEHMDEDFYATAYPKVHENLKLRTDEHVILENPESSSATLSSMKNLDETDNFGDQFLNDKPTEDDQEKTNVVDETDSIIPDPSHQTNTSAPPVTTPVINISSPKPSSQVNAPPINTEATTIITTIPEITPFIALQLRVAKLEQDMSEVKKTDHSAAILASIQSQVPIVVEKYVGTKINAALLKALKRHTADLVEKYFVLPAPESSKK